MTAATRVERDALGERELPAGALYGIHTLRAIENFAITGMPLGRHAGWVAALALVKQAAARANRGVGVLDARRSGAIEAASTEVRGGALLEWFAVDVLQGGAGTSTNMNANEVLANRALQLLGRAPGEYGELHPLEHVNASQSTNDVCPTALRLALIGSADALDAALGTLEDALAAKAREFAALVKLGRTQLQDAVPMTLGHEFGAWAVMVAEDRQRLRETAALLHEVALGGTATGTGLNAPPGYAERACEALGEISGLAVVRAADLVEATQDAGVFVSVSGMLKRIAVKLSKVCNDLRLLASGPRGGLGELRLPAVQAGSSIMPGKVNPVIPESFNQVAFHVAGADVTVTFAVEAGQLQLNAFGPLIGHTLLQAADYLTRAVTMLAERCIRGIAADPEALLRTTQRSLSLATALNPIVGYAAATAVAQEALESGLSVPQVAVARGLLSPAQADELFAPARLAGGGPGIP